MVAKQTFLTRLLLVRFTLLYHICVIAESMLIGFGMACSHLLLLIVTLNDLHQFDLVTLQWNEISRDVDIPAALSFRFGFGFAAVGQSLYVFGGLSGSAGAHFSNESNQCLSKIWLKMSLG